MKRILSFSFVAAMAISSLNAGVLATAKDANITITDEDVAPFLAQGMQHGGQEPTADEKKKLIDDLIKYKLLIAEAKKSGIENSDEYKHQLELAKDGIAFNLWQREQAKDVSVSDEEAKKIYDENKQNFMQPDSVTASHILVADEKAAKNAIAKLSKVKKENLKEEFNKLAKEISIDPSAKENGGDLGSFGKGMMVPEFEKAAFALKDGEMSKTPVKTQRVKTGGESARSKSDAEKTAAEKSLISEKTLSAKITESIDAVKVPASKPLFSDVSTASSFTDEQKPVSEKISFTDFSGVSKPVSRAVSESESEKKLNKKIVIAIVCAAVIIALIAVFF